MQSVTKEENIDVWLPKPARLCRDKNCQPTRCYKNISAGDQYKITDSENRQSIHILPVEEKTESRRHK